MIECDLRAYHLFEHVTAETDIVNNSPQGSVVHDIHYLAFITIILVLLFLWGLVSLPKSESYLT